MAPSLRLTLPPLGRTPTVARYWDDEPSTGPAVGCGGLFIWARSEAASLRTARQDATKRFSQCPPSLHASAFIVPCLPAAVLQARPLSGVHQAVSRDTPQRGAKRRFLHPRGQAGRLPHPGTSARRPG